MLRSVDDVFNGELRGVAQKVKRSNIGMVAGGTSNIAGKVRDVNTRKVQSRRDVIMSPKKECRCADVKRPLQDDRCTDGKRPLQDYLEGRYTEVKLATARGRAR